MPLLLLLSTLSYAPPTPPTLCSSFCASLQQWVLKNASGGPIPGVRPLADWEVLRGAEPAAFLAMLDPSNSPDSPGWPLRNALLMAAVKWRVERLRVLCIRQRGGRNSPAGSLLLTVELPAVPPEWPEAGTPSAVGWELNVRQKTGPRHIDLGSSLDPKQRLEALWGQWATTILTRDWSASLACMERLRDQIAKIVSWKRC